MNAAEREHKFVELHKQYRTRLLRLCLGFAGSQQDAEDLFQDVMMRVWNALPGFRGDAAIGTWLYRIAVNAALLHHRRRKPSEPLAEIADQTSGQQADLELREDIARLRSAIAGLRETDRVIATLLLEDLSYKEIAEVTGYTVNNVGVRISRIKQTLVDVLKESKRARP